MCMTVASFISISASGLIVLRLGPKLTTRIGSSMVGAGLVTVGIGTSIAASPLVVAAGLGILGPGYGQLEYRIQRGRGLAGT